MGYNEVPFRHYLSTLTQYGKESEAYRDLRMNFFDRWDQPYTYVDVLNEVSNGKYLSRLARMIRFSCLSIPLTFGGRFEIRQFRGNHFFIFERPVEVADVIHTHLQLATSHNFLTL